MRLWKCLRGSIPARVLQNPCRERYVRQLAQVASALRTSSDASLNSKDTPKRNAISLRPYQEECINVIVSNLQDGRRRLGVSLATGSGKTVIFTQLIERVPPLSPLATQTLILVHRRELVDQAAKHCMNTYPDKIVEIEMGDSAASGVADITVASVQSLVSQDRLMKFDPSRFKLILIDEAHHAAAPSYTRCLEHFGAATSDSTVNVVGVSATLSRVDGLALSSAMDHIVYHKDYIDMIGEKWLSDVKFTTVKSNADLTKVKDNPHGDYQVAALSRAVNTPLSNEITVRAWLDKAQGRKSTIVFCVDLAHVTDLTNTFRKHGIDARFVTNKTPLKERRQLVESFRRNEYSVLVNCGIFTEGTDIPNIDCVLLARPTKSRNLLVQMIGRGMRLSPGKADCHVIDMVGSFATGIVCVPTLFGLDPNELVDEASASELTQRGKEWAEEKELMDKAELEQTPEYLRLGSVTYTDYDHVDDLLGDVTDPHLRRITQLAWVYCGGHKHILSIARFGFLRVDRDEKTGCMPQRLFYCTETRNLPMELGTPGSSRRVILSKPRTLFENVDGFENAIHAADTYVLNKASRVLCLRDASWRLAPATPEQVNLLNKHREPENALTVEGLTKGKAMDMITRWRHGFKSHLEKEMKKAAKAAKQSEKDRRIQDREAVAVGPMAKDS
ncbi:P-loop containing nucleoside triphosphate hydrolase protein [Saitoella complicata NRRL Y-17804]|uniref:P-loop containing nucleoside triphosphate hydrolase protein n=1 Tax=Saitoella complicata (strain BCRC 22490 / CBS 7301 / JCM 7358 / NBRC 10748 / NRRL Y-17804) TaxID=698492 RepID=UPI000866EBBF|nr:P-loop containing nucleoside triphosphate hydrolase protein [Saitoella complicata NRRL Y-17804]ODQ54468.1 P-loop containing nucleoside triphosphate hydrolase protein [Saitoella complicata NRRL Y-17804]